MIVPGHVVFLWRIIHQHFTLAFLEHISACRRNKPSWPFWKKLPSLAKKFFSLPWTVLCFFLERSQRRTADARSALLVYLRSGKSRRLSFSKQLIHSERCQELKGSSFSLFSFPFNDARYFASVFLRVVGAFLRRLDHLDLRPSLLPYPPPCSPCSRSLKLPWQNEEGVIRLISGQSKQWSALSCTIMLLLHILNAGKTRKRVSGSWVKHILRWSVRESHFTNRKLTYKTDL